MGARTKRTFRENESLMHVIERLTLCAYSAVMWLLQPVLVLKLKLRAKKEPLYSQHMAERFGFYGEISQTANTDKGQWVWVHAVSLGETRAAAILIKALRQAMPDMRLLLTHGTATGREEGKNLLREGDVQVWQPWDTSGATQRFIRHFQPRLGVLMETEVWPNLVHTCVKFEVPLVLANARLSDKSLRQSKRLAWLARPAFAALHGALAQSEADAKRLQTIGAKVLAVTGNLKFDAEPNAEQQAKGLAWRARSQPLRPVLLLASSREGEEAMLLKAWRKVCEAHASQSELNKEARTKHKETSNQATPKLPQLLIVPRHPQRFDAVANLIRAQGFDVLRRQDWGDDFPNSTAGHHTDVVWLGDSLGEMTLYYSMSSVALLGGSFAPFGGQNFIEACAVGCPVITGEHTFNFAQAIALAQQAGAVRCLADMTEALNAATYTLQNPATWHEGCSKAQQFAQQHHGAAWAQAKMIGAMAVVASL